MGKQLRPARVRAAAARLLDARAGAIKAVSRTQPALRLENRQPVWFDAVGAIPPGQIWVRTPAAQLSPPGVKSKRPSKSLFKPQQIVYPEDKLRHEFFSDHPWELARPRIVGEQDGADAKHDSWKSIQQPRRALGGENVVQRQIWLMENEKMTKTEAYDQARKEFYDLRHQEDIERQVAKEEALAVGAYFGPSALDIGMRIEDRSYEEWKRWADQRYLEQGSGLMATASEE